MKCTCDFRGPNMWLGCRCGAAAADANESLRPTRNVVQDALDAAAIAKAVELAASQGDYVEPNYCAPYCKCDACKAAVWMDGMVYKGNPLLAWLPDDMWVTKAEVLTLNGCVFEPGKFEQGWVDCDPTVYEGSEGHFMSSNKYDKGENTCLGWRLVKESK